MILVIGSTGVTGTEVVRRLTERGEAVRAITRDPGKAAGLPGFDRAEIVEGDSTRPEELTAAFEGVQSVYLVPPTTRQWDREQRGLIEQAQRAGVRHMVKLSAIGAAPDEPSMSL